MALHGQPVGDLLELLGVPRGPWPELFEVMVDDIARRDRKQTREEALAKLRGLR